MTADEKAEEVLKSLAALELAFIERLKPINAKLDRALVLLHQIERDVGNPEAKKDQ